MATGLALIPKTIGRLISRSLFTSTPKLGLDLRERRIGHRDQADSLEGERSPAQFSGQKPIEFVDENLLDKVIGNLPFKKLPLIYIKCTRNNTKITLVNGSGDIIALKSAGTEGYKNCRKGTTVAAQSVASRVATIAADNEMNDFRMVFEGLGPGRNPAFKVFAMSGLNIVSFTDRTQAAEPFNKRPRGAKSI